MRGQSVASGLQVRQELDSGRPSSRSLVESQRSVVIQPLLGHGLDRGRQIQMALGEELVLVRGRPVRGWALVAAAAFLLTEPRSAKRIAKTIPKYPFDPGAVTSSTASRS